MAVQMSKALTVREAKTQMRMRMGVMMKWLCRWFVFLRFPLRPVYILHLLYHTCTYVPAKPCVHFNIPAALQSSVSKVNGFLVNRCPLCAVQKVNMYIAKNMQHAEVAARTNALVFALRGFVPEWY